MNKTLLKRSLATATSAVLALGSIATSICSVNAADSLTVTKDWITNVPIKQANLPAPETLAASAGSTNLWGQLGAALSTKTPGQTVTIAKAKYVEKIRPTLVSKLGKYVDADAIDAMIAGLSDGTVTLVDDSKIEVTATLSNIGTVVGQELGKNAAKHGVKFTEYADWSKFVVAGALKLTLNLNTSAKTVETILEFTDELGQKYNISTNAADESALKSYVDRKAKEVAVIGQLSEADAKNFFNKIQKAYDEAKAADNAIRSAKATADNFDTAYAQFLSKAEEKVNAELAKVNGYDKLKAKVADYMAQIPATWQDAIKFNKKGISFDAIAQYIDSFESVDVKLTSDDVINLCASAYDVNVTFDGYSMNATMSIADNQTDENGTILKDAYAAQFADYFAENKLELVSVTSHKVVSIARDDAANTIFFNVERIIDSIETKKIEDTTTTTTDTTTSSSTISNITTTVTTTDVTTSESTSNTSSDVTTTVSTTSDTTSVSTTSDTTSASTTSDTTSASTTSDTTSASTTSDTTSASTTSETTSASTTSETTSASTTSETTSASTTSETTSASTTSETTSGSTTSETTSGSTTSETTSGSTTSETTSGSTTSETTSGSTTSDTTSGSTTSNTTSGSTTSDTTSDTTTSDTTTTVTTTTTSGKYAFELDVKTITDTNIIGYYWTEEEDEFSCFKSFAGAMNIFAEDGSVAESVALTAADFSISNKNADSFNAASYTKADIKVTLSAEGIAKITAICEKFNITVPTADEVVATYNVILVVRGNMQLTDNKVTPVDATAALKFYAQTEILKDEVTASEVLSIFPDELTQEQYAGILYAMDVNADGAIDTKDATAMLIYYAIVGINQEETTFDAVCGDSMKEHSEEMHLDPMASFEK